MSSLVKINLKLNNFALNEAIRKASNVSKHLPSYLVNKACNQIANRAHNSMPVVPVAKITAEMSAKKSASEINALFKAGNEDKNGTLTMAQRIVLARMQPNSEFNRRTGGVWRLQKPVFSTNNPLGRGGNKLYSLGKNSATQFWDWVDEKAKIMVAARRKSSGFYKLGAAVVRLIFSRSRLGKVGETGQAMPGGGNVGKAIGRVAGGSPAQGSSNYARASFWVSTTEPDTKGNGGGIERVLEPVWQKATDAEAASIHAYAEAQYAKVLQEAGF